MKWFTSESLDRRYELVRSGKFVTGREVARDNKGEPFSLHARFPLSSHLSFSVSPRFFVGMPFSERIINSGPSLISALAFLRHRLSLCTDQRVSAKIVFFLIPSSRTELSWNGWFFLFSRQNDSRRDVPMVAEWGENGRINFKPGSCILRNFN